MWPFSNKEKERADALEAQMQELLAAQEARDKKDREREAKEAEEAEALRLAEEEANRTARLAAEEAERKEAEKTLATERGEPYINIVSMDMEPGDGANIGAIEMDWNDQFIVMLQQNGYVGTSDEDAVDQWFRDVCRHVVLETYEDEETGQLTTRTDLEDGRAEYS